MQKIDFQITPGVPVFSFDFNTMGHVLANGRNTFNIFIQNRLKGTQKGPIDVFKYSSLSFIHHYALSLFLDSCMFKYCIT